MPPEEELHTFGTGRGSTPSSVSAEYDEKLLEEEENVTPLKEQTGDVHTTLKRLQRLERGCWKPSGEMNAVLSFALFVLLAYTTYVAVFNKSWTEPFATSANETNSSVESTLPLSNSLLSLFIVLVCGLVLGNLLHRIHLPELLGMLIVGILLRNLPWTSSVVVVDKAWSVVLRKVAFIIILLRGGLSLDAKALMKLKGACIRLSLLPCSVEAVTVCIVAKLVLDIDWLFGLLLGFVLAAVSPAVIVPSMVEAQAQGLGTAAGIPTLIIAAASIDDVYAITLFSLLLSVVFSTGSSVWITLIRAPAEVISGVFFGAIFGAVLWYLPSSDQPNKRVVRLVLLLAFATTLLFGTTRLHCDAIGAIAVLVMAFVAAFRWKEQDVVVEERYLSLLWKLVFMPILFGLIGLELSFDSIGLSSVLLGLVVLAVGVTLRTVAAYCAVLGTNLKMKERIFVAIAWTPKATVQAALAPVALEMATSGLYSADYERYGVEILTIAVLSILTTAPIGAFLIRLLMPRMLVRSERVAVNAEERDEKWTIRNSQDEKLTIPQEKDEKLVAKSTNGGRQGQESVETSARSGDHC